MTYYCAFSMLCIIHKLPNIFSIHKIIFTYASPIHLIFLPLAWIFTTISKCLCSLPVSFIILPLTRILRPIRISMYPKTMSLITLKLTTILSDVYRFSFNCNLLNYHIKRLIFLSDILRIVHFIFRRPTRKPRSQIFNEKISYFLLYILSVLENLILKVFMIFADEILFSLFLEYFLYIRILITIPLTALLFIFKDTYIKI